MPRFRAFISIWGLLVVLAAVPLAHASERENNIRRLMEVNHDAEMVRWQLRYAFAAALLHLRQSHPELSAKKLDSIEQAANAAIDELMPEAMAAMEATYGETLTDEEIAAWVQFAETPTGRQIANKFPEMNKRMTRNLAVVIKRVVEKTVRDAQLSAR